MANDILQKFKQHTTELAADAKRLAADAKSLATNLVLNPDPGLPLEGLAESLEIGNCDVVSNSQYKWREDVITDPTEIPRIELMEYELTNNALYSFSVRLQKQYNTLTNSDDSSNSPYAGLYSGRPTGVFYKFPFFSSVVANSQTTWNDNGQVAQTKTANIVVNFATGLFNTAMDASNDLGNVSPSIYQPKPMVWAGTSNGTVQFEFYLLNTNTGSERVWFNHWRLITYLRLSVLHNQRNAVFAVPPSIFTMNIPSVRYSPACYISNLSIDQLGHITPYTALAKVANGLTDQQLAQKELYIPDAWKVNITIQDLLPMSRQIIKHGLLKDGSKTSIVAIKEAPPEESIVENIGEIYKAITTTANSDAVTQSINNASVDSATKPAARGN